MKKKFLIVIPLSAIAVGLAYLLKDIMQSLVIDPILYIIWVARLIYLAIPQIIWWGIFLVILAWVVLRSFRGRTKYAPQGALEEATSRSRLETWYGWIEQTSRGDYFKWRLANQFSILAMEILAHRYRLTPEQVKEELAAGHIDLPPDKLAYLQSGLDNRGAMHNSKRERFWHSNLSSPQRPVDIEDLIIFIESEFEGSSYGAFTGSIDRKD